MSREAGHEALLPPEHHPELPPGSEPGREAGSEESFWRIVGRQVKEAPPRSRRVLWILVGSGVLAIGLQVFVDSWKHEGLEGWAELLSVFTGTLGSLLVAFAYVLHDSAMSSKGCRGWGLSFHPRVFHRVLLALPVLGLAGGSLLGASVGLLIIRAVHHSPILWAAAAVYLGILLLAARVVHGTTRFLFRYSREQAEQVAEARSQVTEAQLAALQARMNPHFLFNALNTVAALVRESPESAERTVENLSDVLRRTLDRSRDPLRTVGDEVDYLRSYLTVEQERWGDRLKVEWNVDPATRDLALPTMSLQPLVENALVHGLGAHLDGGKLTVGAELAGDRLVLTVTDDGAGYSPRAEEGMGLGNLRRRLETLYGDEASLRVERRHPGTRAVLELPGRKADTSTSGLP